MIHAGIDAGAHRSPAAARPPGTMPRSEHGGSGDPRPQLRLSGRADDQEMAMATKKANTMV